MNSDHRSDPMGSLPKNGGQLFGGPEDGRDILLPRSGPPPQSQRHAGLLYCLDGYLTDGRPRYSRPIQSWPYHKQKP